jgi:hypothetical protein
MINYKNLVKGTLANDSFVLVNKNLALRIGFLEAGLLGEIIAIHGMCEKEESLIEDEWLYITQPYIENHLGIKRKQFENAIKNLLNLDIMEQKKMGLPAKNYYRIFWEKIAQIASEPAPQSACTKRATKDVPNVQPDNSQLAPNVQPRMYETCNQGFTKRTPIKITNKNNHINLNNNNQSVSHLTDELLTKYLPEIDHDRRTDFYKAFEFYQEKLDSFDMKCIVSKISQYQNIQVRAFKRYLNTVIVNYLKEKEPVPVVVQTNPARKEYLPDWFEESPKEESKPKMTEEEILQKSAEIDEMLKQLDDSAEIAKKKQEIQDKLKAFRGE